MAIIFGGIPQQEREEPMARPESEVKRDVEAVENGAASGAQSEETEVVPKKAAKKSRRNVKK